MILLVFTYIFDLDLDFPVMLLFPTRWCSCGSLEHHILQTIIDKSSTRRRLDPFRLKLYVESDIATDFTRRPWVQPLTTVEGTQARTQELRTRIGLANIMGEVSPIGPLS